MTIIGVSGAGSCDEQVAAIARQVGELIAQKGAAVVCGGLGGVMEAAAAGACAYGGLTIGLLPGGNRRDANPHIKIPIVTDLGHARNAVLAQTAQGLVAVAGEYGTLSEISMALKLGKPVVALGKWGALEGVQSANSPEEAVETVFAQID